jgi:hypothetical protein
VGSFVALVALSASAERLDPTVPIRWMVGHPNGYSSMQRLDAARSGRSRVPFPRDPVVLFRVRLPAPLAAPLVVDAHGKLVVATTDGRITELDDEGRLEWSTLLDGAVSQSPVLTVDGTRVAVTDGGQVVGLGPDGHERYRARVGGGGRSAALATDDDAVIVASATRLARFGPFGELQATIETGEPVVSLVGAATPTYAATESGDVFEWTRSTGLRQVADLEGHPASDLVQLGRWSLLAVVRDVGLVEVDLRDGTRVVRANPAPDAFLGAPIMTPSGELRATTAAGFVLGYQGGRETLRLSLGRGTATGTGASVSGAGPLVDPTGVMGFATADGLAGVVLPSNEVHAVRVEGCGAPLGVAVAGPSRLAVACASGEVVVLAERAAIGVPASAR